MVFEWRQGGHIFMHCTVPELQLAYISSSLEFGSDCPVMVSGIQNGVNNFLVRKLSPDVERTRIQLNLSLKQVEVYQLS